MAQHSLDYDVVQRTTREDETDRKGLGYEKVGVITGFLVGLPVGVGLVETPLASAGVPQWLGIIATVIVVSVFTSLGLRAGMAMARHIAQNKPE